MSELRSGWKRDAATVLLRHASPAAQPVVYSLASGHLFSFCCPLVVLK